MIHVRGIALRSRRKGSWALAAPGRQGVPTTPVLSAFSEIIPATRCLQVNTPTAPNSWVNWRHKDLHKSNLENTLAVTGPERALLNFG